VSVKCLRRGWAGGSKNELREQGFEGTRPGTRLIWKYATRTNDGKSMIRYTSRNLILLISHSQLLDSQLKTRMHGVTSPPDQTRSITKDALQCHDCTGGAGDGPYSLALCGIEMLECGIEQNPLGCITMITEMRESVRYLMRKAGIYQSDIPWQISRWKADMSILQYIVAELLHGERSLKADRAFLERDLSLLLPLSGSTHSLARIWVFLSFSIRRTLFPIVRTF
jgi:hypothetical protein